MTLEELRASARSKADETSTDFVDNDELDRFLNQGYRYVYRKVARMPETPLKTRGTLLNGGIFDTVNDVDTYIWPTTAKEIVGVETRQAGQLLESDWRSIDKVLSSTRPLGEYYPPREGYTYGLSRGYYLEGRTIVFRPVPTSPYQVRVFFVPKLVPLSDPADEPVIDEDLQEFIPEFAALQTLRRSGEGIFTESYKLFEIELAEVIEAMLAYQRGPEQMNITEGSDY